MNGMFVTGLVLAAGGSSRLGQPKQVLPYDGTTLLDAVLRTVRACAFDQVLVTLGGAADLIFETVDLNGVTTVLNLSYGSGCSSSIVSALDAVDRGFRVVVAVDAVTSFSPDGHRATIDHVLPRFEHMLDLAVSADILAAWNK